MEQFGKKSYLSPLMEIVELAEDVVTESVELKWGSDWSIEDDGFAQG